MGRTLAHIEKIEWIEPIPRKDRIALAGVLGWTVIVNKDEYNVGDNCVFCEIDSVFPEKPEYEFLRKRKFRIKTMKMGGVLSQGICFPLSVLPKGSYKIGDDVTELMGITQFEGTMDQEEQPSKEREAQPKKKYPKFLMKQQWFRNWVTPKKQTQGFPSFIAKTDEQRVQNVPYVLKMDCKWVATEKVDGQSGSFTLQRVKGRHFWNKDTFDFAVCSRNLRLPKKNDSSYWSVAQTYHIKEVLQNLIGEQEWVAIQGECVAPNVQKNKYKVTEPDLYVFNLIYPEGRVGSIKAKKIVEEQGLKFVPIIETDVELKGKSVADVLAYADGKSQLYDTLREGIVFRNVDGTQSFKAVSPEFLIKHNE
ncbi:MAG: RNA ligase family protein [Lachnospiraceae bacterium]